MAKLRVAPELLVQVLFSGADIEIRGASFDAQRRLIMLDIAGPEDGFPASLFADHIRSAKAKSLNRIRFLTSFRARTAHQPRRP